MRFEKHTEKLSSHKTVDALANVSSWQLVIAAGAAKTAQSCIIWIHNWFIGIIQSHNFK